MLAEIDNLHIKIQEITDEYQRLYADCKDYLSLKQNPQGSSDSIMQGHQRLLMRIEELEDLVVELKSQQSPTENLDLKALLLQKEHENQLLNNKVEELRKLRVRAKDLFDNNELYVTFQKAIKEREDVISKMKNELSQIKNSSFINKIQEPKSNADQGKITLGGGVINTKSWANERDSWLVQKFPTET